MHGNHQPDKVQKDITMRFRSVMLAGLAVALTACTTTSLPATNPIESRWKGQSAGVFFAKYGPPISDTASGSETLYTWRGGYKNTRVPAKYEQDKDGKRGKQIAAARTVYLSCTVQITASEDYRIRSIRTVADRPGVNGPSYCAEFLTAE